MTTTKTIYVDEDAGQISVDTKWFGNGGGNVHFEAVSGTAILGKDFQAVPKTVFIPANSSGIYSLTVNLVNDDIKEGQESFVVRGYNENYSDGDEYRYTIIINDNDTGVLQPDGSVVGPAKTAQENTLKKLVVDSLGNMASGLHTAYESKYIVDADIPSWDITNVKYNTIENASGSNVFNSMLDFNFVKNGAKAFDVAINTYKAFDTAAEVLNKPNGTVADAVKAGCSAFIIAVASGEIGSVVGAGVMAGAALAGAPALVGIAAGVLAGGIIAGVVENYSTDLAKMAGLIPGGTSLQAQSVMAFDGTSIINPALVFKGAAPTPTWTFDPATGEFHWLVQPDPEHIREIATRFGIETANPVNFNIVGDTTSDPNDVLYGGSGSDHIQGLTGDDVIFGQAGIDNLEGGSGRDVLDGGAGDDILSGGDGNDQLNGDSGGDYLLGGSGDDQLWGKLGDDILDGGDGDDDIRGGDGLDKLVGSAGADKYDGGADIDTVNFAAAPSGVHFQLGGFGFGSGGDDDWSSGDRFISVENAVGSVFDDEISDQSVGDPVSNSMTGGKGNDTLIAHFGEDLLDGGDGNDTLIVYDLSAGDRVFGGRGVDSFEATTGSTDDHLVVKGSASLSVVLNPNADGTGGATVAGTVDDVSLFTGAGSDVVDALRSSRGVTADLGTGRDTFLGGVGDDRITLDGLDTLDVVHGGTGTDSLKIVATGNVSDDRIVLAGTASISVQLGLLGPVVADGIEALELHTAGGNDYVDSRGTPMDVVIDVGSGTDTVLAGAGNDRILIDELDVTDVLSAGDGLDSLVVGGAGDTSADWFFVKSAGTSNAVTIFPSGDVSKQTLVATGFESVELHAGAGDDVVDGQAAFGAIILNGGAGGDTIWGGVNDDQLFGDEFGYPGGGNDTIFGGNGNDFIVGGYGTDTLYGGAGNDEISSGTGGGSVSHGGDDSDKLFGSAGDDHLFGDDGADTFVSGAGNDEINGGDGDDIIIASAFPEAGSDAIDGGDGMDLLTWTGNDVPGVPPGDVAATYKLEIDLTAHTITAYGYIQGGFAFQSHSTIYNVENLRGQYDDASFLRGDSQANSIQVGDASSSAWGMDGSDTLIGGRADDLLDGGNDSDTASYIAAAASVTVDLAKTGPQATGGGGADTLISIENLTGSNFDDSLAGDANSNVLSGQDGADRLSGGLGADTLIGGLGNDDLDGGANPELGQPGAQGDVMLGGDGNDTYHVDSGLDLVDEGSYFAAYGFGGTDTIISTTDFYWDVASVGEVVQVAENVVDANNDGVTIVGGVFDNTLIGHSGTDVLFGRGGNDTYRAGDGVDFISLSTLGVTDTANYTADGHNTIIVDPRTSGPNSYDIVFEFDPARDKIDVSHYTGAHDYKSGAEVLSRAVDDGAGNCYIALGDGLDYVYLVGVLKAQLLASDFIV